MNTTTALLNPTEEANLSAPGTSVECRNLWKVFGPKPDAFVADPSNERLKAHHTAAVRGVSFHVEPGETFVIMGLSGSGKSTLIRCLTRLIEPTQGEILIGDRSVTGCSEEELREMRRRETAMVFQHFGLLKHKSVLANAAYGLEVRGEGRAEREARAKDILKIVGLQRWESRYPDELSGGMKQRVGLARALAMDPRVLLLDEPFSALDPLIRRELQDELLNLAGTLKKTLIFITHDMSEALKLGDRIAIMRQGELVQVGTPEEILLHPADDYVRRFTEDTSRARFVHAQGVATPFPTVRADVAADEAIEMAGKLGAPGVVVEDPNGPRVVLIDDLRGASAPDRLAATATSAQVVEPTLRLVEVAQRLIDTRSPLLVLLPAGGYGLIEVSNVLAALADITEDAPPAVKSA